jgi:hypothetical protein
MELSGTIRAWQTVLWQDVGGSQMRAIILAGATGLLLAAGVTQSAHAEFTFRNDTSERVVFNLQCHNGRYELLSIDPNRSQAYRCSNGARDAVLEVYTDDDSADGGAADDDEVDTFLVRDQVHDTETYAFFRDAVGYVEVVRFR